jgi:hypothetical protein
MQRFKYDPWTVEQAMAALRALGCTCNDSNLDDRGITPSGQKVFIKAGISQDSYESIDNPRSYRCRHSCNGCGKSTLEIADPTYQPGERSRRMQRLQGVHDKD